MAFDLAVIGGGINGAAIARDAALRGLSVSLFEKKDFGSGASTKTSKLVHGGLRYLESLEIGLIRESLYERSLLLQNASHLVKPLPFILPVYKQDRHPLWQIDLGLYLYDFLARNGKLPSHSKLDVKSIQDIFPKLIKENLCGGCLYYDAQMNDSRLLIETILGAELAGAEAYNYSEVIDVVKDETNNVFGILVKDQINDKTLTISAKIVVNATGAWTNEFLGKETENTVGDVIPTKGVHIVIPQIAAHMALLLLAPQDGRVFFILPWEGKSLVGTTDTYYAGNLDQVKSDIKDVKYLIEAFNHYFPSHSIKEEDIQCSFAGVRPLVDGSHKGPPSDISRRHLIKKSASGLITVLGGKFTTHRKIAEETVNIIMKDLGKNTSCYTISKPLPGVFNENSKQLLKDAFFQEGIQDDQCTHLLETYGEIGWSILEIMRRDPEEKKQICSLHPHLYAELTYAIEHEHVKTSEDWYYRRSSIAYATACKGKCCYDQVALQLSKKDHREEKKNSRNTLQKTMYSG